MKRSVPIEVVPRRVFTLAIALACLFAACDTESGGDLWSGDPAELSGVWRSRDVAPEGRPYLVLDLSGVYRVVVETETQALEIDRGSYVIEGGVLVRVTTRNLDPHMLGTRTENGVYRVTETELVLEPSDPGGKQLFYSRVDAPPDYRPLP